MCVSVSVCECGVCVCERAFSCVGVSVRISMFVCERLLCVFVSICVCFVFI